MWFSDKAKLMPDVILVGGKMFHQFGQKSVWALFKRVK